MRRIKRVYLPFIMAAGFWLILIGIFSKVKLSAVSIVSYVTDTQWFVGGVKGLGHLWFVTAIAICYLATPLLQGLKRKSWLLGQLLLLFSFYEFCILQYDLLLFKPLLIYAMGYFYAGMSKRQKGLLIAELAIVVGAILYIIDWKHILIYDSIMNQVFHTYMGILFPILFIEGISCMHLQKESEAAKWLDHESYYIYLMHHPLILGGLSLMAMTSSLAVNIMVILILTFLLSIGLKRLTRIKISL